MPIAQGNDLSTLPKWARAREGWWYCGWIRFTTPGEFNQACYRALRSDHGELRGLDIYPEGAVEWCKETE